MKQFVNVCRLVFCVRIFAEAPLTLPRLIKLWRLFCTSSYARALLLMLLMQSSLILLLKLLAAMFEAANVRHFLSNLFLSLLYESKKSKINWFFAVDKSQRLFIRFSAAFATGAKFFSGELPPICIGTSIYFLELEQRARVFNWLCKALFCWPIFPMCILYTTIIVASEFCKRKEKLCARVCGELSQFGCLPPSSSCLPHKMHVLTCVGQLRK